LDLDDFVSSVPWEHPAQTLRGMKVECHEPLLDMSDFVSNVPCEHSAQIQRGMKEELGDYDFDPCLCASI
jgi:hypothetical protein